MLPPALSHSVSWAHGIASSGQDVRAVQEGPATDASVFCITWLGTTRPALGHNHYVAPEESVVSYQ